MNEMDQLLERKEKRHLREKKKNHNESPNQLPKENELITENNRQFSDSSTINPVLTKKLTKSHKSALRSKKVIYNRNN